jgi:hypothetical protein
MSNGSDKTATAAQDEPEKSNVEEKEKKSPFEPPYVEDLFVGELEGLEGEDGMAVLVCLQFNVAVWRGPNIRCLPKYS